MARARGNSDLKIDGVLLAKAVTAGLVHEMSRAGPFGAGNAEPVVALPAHEIVYAEEVGQAHVRLRLRGGDGANVNAIAFRAAGQKLGHALLDNRGQRVHVAGTLSIDRWQGNERVQMRVIDMALPVQGPTYIR